MFVFCHLKQLLNPTLDGELGGAGDLPGRGRGDAGVEAGVLRVDVLEDEGEGVLLVLEEHLEAVLGVELLAGLEPGEGRLLALDQLLLVPGQEGEDILGVCGKGEGLMSTPICSTGFHPAVWITLGGTKVEHTRTGLSSKNRM